MADKKTVTVGDSVLKTAFETTVGDNKSYPMEQRILYLGQDGARFTLGYREMGDGRAREPFNENVVYQAPPTGSSTEIAFRTARLRVYSVSNLGIEFEILEGEERI
jgi:hypothetical protein